MDGLNDFRQLRVTTGLGGDVVDFAATQTSPSTSDMVELRAPHRDKSPQRIKVEIVLEWLNASDVVVAGRGSYDVQAVRVTTRRGPLTGTAIVDSAKLSGQMAHRPVLIDDVYVGDTFTVRLTNLAPPGGIGITKARVLYREIL